MCEIQNSNKKEKILNCFFGPAYNEKNKTFLVLFAHVKKHAKTLYEIKIINFYYFFITFYGIVLYNNVFLHVLYIQEQLN